MSRARPFFGWYIVLAFGLMVFVSTGIRFTVGPFLKPIVADLGIDRASFSLAVALSLFLYGVFMAVLGRLVERVGTRPVLVAGTVAVAVSMIGTSFVTRLWQFYLTYSIGTAIGLAATGQIVGTAVVSRWFVRRRATALSIVSSFGMSGMTLMVPFAAWLIGHVGWRSTYMVMGVFAMVVTLPLGLWVVRDSPESMGLHPDGADAPPAGSRGGRSAVGGTESTPMMVAMQSLPFWQIAVVLFSCGFSMSLLTSHGVPMLTDHGYSALTASWVLGMAGGSSMAFSVVIGALGDRFGRPPMMAWLYGSRALVFLALFTIRDNPGALFVVALMAGTSMAGTVALSSALTADIFGRFSVGSIYGTMFIIHQTGSALGSWLGGVLFEVTSGYGAAFLVAGVLLTIAAAVSLSIDVRPRTAPVLAPVAGGR
jgi:MFS family permease